MKPQKVYLGDGLYAVDLGYQIELTAEDGRNVLQMVALEENVLDAFFKFVERSRGLRITIDQVEVRDDSE